MKLCPNQLQYYYWGAVDVNGINYSLLKEKKSTTYNSKLNCVEGAYRL